MPVDTGAMLGGRARLVRLFSRNPHTRGVDCQWVAEPPWRRAAAEWQKVCAFTLMRVLGERYCLADSDTHTLCERASEGCRPKLPRWPCRVYTHAAPPKAAGEVPSPRFPRHLQYPYVRIQHE